jgi:hypothetical protein
MPPRPRKSPHIHQRSNSILPKRPQKRIDRQSRVPNRHHFHTSLKNKVQNSGINSDAKNHHPKHHNSPANHHNLTTKNHHENATSPQKPPAKTPLHHTPRKSKKRSPAKSQAPNFIRSDLQKSAVNYTPA